MYKLISQISKDPVEEVPFNDVLNVIKGTPAKNLLRLFKLDTADTITSGNGYIEFSFKSIDFNSPIPKGCGLLRELFHKKDWKNLNAPAITIRITLVLDEHGKPLALIPSQQWCTNVGIKKGFYISLYDYTITFDALRTEDASHLTEYLKALESKTRLQKCLGNRKGFSVLNSSTFLLVQVKSPSSYSVRSFSSSTVPEIDTPCQKTPSLAWSVLVLFPTVYDPSRHHQDTPDGPSGCDTFFIETILAKVNKLDFPTLNARLFVEDCAGSGWISVLIQLYLRSKYPREELNIKIHTNDINAIARENALANTRDIHAYPISNSTDNAALFVANAPSYVITHRKLTKELSSKQDERFPTLLELKSPKDRDAKFRNALLIYLTVKCTEINEAPLRFYHDGCNGALFWRNLLRNLDQQNVLAPGGFAILWNSTASENTCKDCSTMSQNLITDFIVSLGKEREWSVIDDDESGHFRSMIWPMTYTIGRPEIHTSGRPEIHTSECFTSINRP